MISGQTAAWANASKSLASAASVGAGIASVGMTVADLDRIAVTLKARNAKPLFFTSTANGGQNPGYAVVLPPDQYNDLMQESVMKSAVFLSVAPGPDHPLRSGAMIKYNNLWVFELQGDFRDEQLLADVLQCVGDDRFDLVMSDMAPNITGTRSVDQPRTMYLAELAAELAFRVLAKRGALVVKLFHGEGFDAFVRDMRRRYATVKVRKPKASRPDSRETYLVARNIRL